MTEKTTRRSFSAIILSAAFLMATSAVGPGFLTQTAKFTKDFAASFGFVILISVVIDIFAQLNIWRVLAVSGKRGQDVANETVPYSGYVLAALIVFGGLAFNIGNIAGAGLGLNVLFGLEPEYGALISGVIGIAIFAFKDASRAMDFFVKLLGFVMLSLIVYVVFVSGPPVGEAVYRTFWPETISPFAIITLVGGTVGGYITFAGAHRLIDGWMTGVDSLRDINRSATSGILLTAVIRFLLFLAAFGVVALGLTIDDKNPPASVFQLAAGPIGYKLFGIVMWAAAVTSVIGAAYTSVSFLKTFSSKVSDHTRYFTMGFIAFSTLVFLFYGRPVTVLIFAGTFNGFILPFGLALVLLASGRNSIIGDYKHPLWLKISGWLVVAVMLMFSIQTVIGKLS
jgi:Mn2+/Fe2+ NRAMP family transporter